jgi:hypothetical protein
MSNGPAPAESGLAVSPVTHAAAALQPAAHPPVQANMNAASTTDATGRPMMPMSQPPNAMGDPSQQHLVPLTADPGAWGPVDTSPTVLGRDHQPTRSRDEFTVPEEGKQP